MKKTRIILLLFSAMQLAGINNISANTENGLHLTTASLKVKADGKELCTAELQKAIDRIAAQGGGHLPLRDRDFRPAFVFDDVRQLTMEQVTPDESVFN